MGKWEMSYAIENNQCDDLTTVTLLIFEISQVYRVISKEASSPVLRAAPMHTCSIPSEEAVSLPALPLSP